MFFDLFDFLKILKAKQHNYNQNHANFWFWVCAVNHWHLRPWIKFSNLKFFSSSLIILWGALENCVLVIFILLDLSVEVVLQSSEILKVRWPKYWSFLHRMSIPQRNRLQLCLSFSWTQFMYHSNVLFRQFYMNRLAQDSILKKKFTANYNFPYLFNSQISRYSKTCFILRNACPPPAAINQV